MKCKVSVKKFIITYLKNYLHIFFKATMNFVYTITIHLIILFVKALRIIKEIDIL